MKITIIVLLAISGLLSACATPSSKPLHDKQALAVAEQAYQAADYVSAQAKFEALLKQSPQSHDALFRLGNIALRQTRLADARDYYRRTLALQPSASKAHYNLALVNLLDAEQHFHFHTATAQDNTAQQARLFTLISAIREFLDDDDQSKTPESALDKLADALEQKQL